MAPSFTKIYPRVASLAALLLACSFLTTASASAQAGFVRNKPGDLPDSSQFYMSRRQIQYVDDSPVVKFSGGGGPSAAGGSGPTPTGGQMALPRAGFGTNINSGAPSITTPLPKVNNGVPVKPTAAEEKAMQAKALSLSRAQAKAVAAAKPKAPPPPEGIKAYNSYKGYNPAGSLAGVSGGAASASTAEGKVKGSVLHWSRRRKAE
jgi:hypothetical protein